MIKKTILSILLLGSFVYGESIKSPEEIHIELQKAEAEFDVAQKMFLPWYTGPLITGSASNVPPGQIMIQPYLYLTVNHAQFNNHRHSVGTPNSYVINPLIVLQTGITPWMDFTVVPQGLFKWQQGQFGAGFGDLTTQIGFPLSKEGLYMPKMRLLFGEIFPTGKYQRLNPNKLGLDSSGSGVFQTTIGLNMSKVFWWFPLHPIATRFGSSYAIPDNRVRVHGFNSYGGGHGTDGKIKQGNTLNLDIGIEVSINQKWVFATDIAYTNTTKSTFKGHSGTTDSGAPASNGLPYSDNLSLAPAIEYNQSENAGFIAGIWFPVTGKNSSNFVSLVFSYCLVI